MTTQGIPFRRSSTGHYKSPANYVTPARSGNAEMIRERAWREACQKMRAGVDLSRVIHDLRCRYAFAHDVNYGKAEVDET